jgi:hypothetical protein
MWRRLLKRCGSVLVAWRPRPKSRQGGGASPYALFDTPTIDPGSYHPAHMRLPRLALFDHLEISVGFGSLILDGAVQCLADHRVHDVRHDDSR